MSTGASERSVRKKCLALNSPSADWVTHKERASVHQCFGEVCTKKMSTGGDSGRGTGEGGEERNTGNDGPSLISSWRKEGQVSGAEEDNIKGGGGQRMQTEGKTRERLEELKGKWRIGEREIP